MTLRADDKCFGKELLGALGGTGEEARRGPVPRQARRAHVLLTWLISNG